MDGSVTRCPTCQGLVPGEGRRRCPFCGAEVDGAEASDRRDPPADDGATPYGAGRWEERREGDIPPAGGGEVQEVRPPWEKGGGNAVSNLVETWKAATFRPTEFFRSLPAEPIGPAFLYGWLMSGIGMGAQFFWISLQSMGDGDATGALTAPFFFLVGIAFAALSVAWNALVVHLGCMILGAAERKFPATFRAVAYAQGPQIFAAVPLLGFFTSFWILFIEVIAIREMQRTTSTRALFAIILPGLILLALIGIFILAIIALIGGAIFGALG